MDEVTGLYNHQQPICTKSTIVIAAKDDAYIPFEDIRVFKDFWPDSELRVTEGGHISSFLFGQEIFTQAIIDSFKKLENRA